MRPKENLELKSGIAPVFEVESFGLPWLKIDIMGLTQKNLSHIEIILIYLFDVCIKLIFVYMRYSLNEERIRDILVRMYRYDIHPFALLVFEDLILGVNSHGCLLVDIHLPVREIFMGWKFACHVIICH